MAAGEENISSMLLPSFFFLLLELYADSTNFEIILGGYKKFVDL